jgi:hypothetical protein
MIELNPFPWSEKIKQGIEEQQYETRIEYTGRAPGRD